MAPPAALTQSTGGGGLPPLPVVSVTVVSGVLMGGVSTGGPPLRSPGRSVMLATGVMVTLAMPQAPNSCWLQGEGADRRGKKAPDVFAWA